MLLKNFVFVPKYTKKRVWRVFDVTVLQFLTTKAVCGFYNVLACQEWLQGYTVYQNEIIWIICWFWLVIKCGFIALWSTKMTSNMVGCLQVVRIYSFMKEIKVYIRASYIVFLFVNNENNNFIKEIKHVVHAFITCWKSRQCLWEFSSWWKPSTASQVFTELLSNSPKLLPRFHQAMKAWRTCFIS